MTHVAFVTCLRSPSSQQLARSLASDGWVVYGVSNDHDLSMALEKQGIHVSDINVVDDTAVAWYIKHLAKAEGRIDHVFHTAGHHSFAALELHDGTDGRFQFEVNLFGAMNVLREVAMIMRSQNFGSFTLFSPGPVPKPHPFAGWHNACEAAISSMMTSARLELGQFGMRINHVHWGLQSTLGRDLAPSYIDHIGHAHAYEESVEQAEQGIDRLVEGGRNIDHSVALGVQLATGDQFHGAQSRWRAKIGAAQTVLARYGLGVFRK